MAVAFPAIGPDNKLPAAVLGELNATFVDKGSLPLAVTQEISTAGQDSYEYLKATYASARSGVTPESKGAVGDGVAGDDAAMGEAIASAVAFGAPVLLTERYALASRLTLNDPVKFHGPGTIVKTGATDTNWITFLTSGVEFGGITFDGAGLITSMGVSIAAGLSDVTVRGCDFENLPIGVRVRGTQNVNISGNAFTNTAQPVHASEDLSGQINANTISQWTNRGIYVDGTTSGSHDLEIIGNRIIDHTGGGTPRHPIQVIGIASSPHLRIKVNHNRVLGPGKSWTAADPGTADQISLHHARDFEVIGNYSEGGGDMGLTVSQECRRGKVHDNVCTLNDVAGLTLGSSQSAFIRDISVKGNICFNNGQNRNGDRNPEGRVGVRVVNGISCMVKDNLTGDDQTTKTQQYGVSIIDSVEVTEHGNLDDGNALGPLYWANSTGPRIAYSEAVGKIGVTLTANTTATAEIVFPPGRFTQPPILQLYVRGASLTDAVHTTFSSTSATGASVTARCAVNRTVTIQWTATQMTPDSAEG